MNDMNKQMHYVLYHSDETDVSVNAVIQNDSIWVAQKAESEYDVFNKTQKITSDFDKAVEKMLESKGEKHNL